MYVCMSVCMDVCMYVCKKRGRGGSEGVRESAEEVAWKAAPTNDVADDPRRKHKHAKPTQTRTSTSSNSYKTANLHMASTQFGSCSPHWCTWCMAIQYPHIWGSFCFFFWLNYSIMARIATAKRGEWCNWGEFGDTAGSTTFLKAAWKSLSASSGSPSPQSDHPSETSLETSVSSS